MDYNFNAENAQKFNCIRCDFVCCKLSNWNKHLLTSKHKKNDTELQMDYIFDAAKDNIEYICECGKIYKHRQGLWKHRQKCNFDDMQNSIVTCNDPPNNDLVTYLMNENKELKNMIMEVCKSNSNTINNNINNTLG